MYTCNKDHYNRTYYYHLLVLVMMMIICWTTSNSMELDCDKDKRSQKLQIMFLIDQTGSYNKYYQSISASLKLVAIQINNIHPDAEFAVAVFGNWETEAGVSSSGSNINSCYMLIQSFTANLDKVKQSIDNFQPAGGRNRENALAALAFAASDPNANWDEPVDLLDGENTLPPPIKQTTRRFIILMTDTPNQFVMTHKGSRQEFRGDGTDNCATSLNPSLSDIRRVLMQRDFNVVGFYSNSTVTDEYDDHFWSLGVPYCAGDFDDRVDGFTRAFEATLYRCVRGVLACVRGGGGGET